MTRPDWNQYTINDSVAVVKHNKPGFLSITIRKAKEKANKSKIFLKLKKKKKWQCTECQAVAELSTENPTRVYLWLACEECGKGVCHYRGWSSLYPVTRAGIPWGHRHGSSRVKNRRDASDVGPIDIVHVHPHTKSHAHWCHHGHLKLLLHGHW